MNAPIALASLVGARLPVTPPSPSHRVRRRRRRQEHGATLKLRRAFASAIHRGRLHDDVADAGPLIRRDLAATPCGAPNQRPTPVADG